MSSNIGQFLKFAVRWRHEDKAMVMPANSAAR